MSTIGDRLGERLRDLGMGQSELARRVRMKPQGVQSIIAGKVARPKKLREIAAAVGVSQEYLLGETDDLRGEPSASGLVPLVGYVGAGAEAHYYAEAQGPFDMVPAPDGSTESTVAVEIRGESLGSFFDHWLVFYDDVRAPVTADLIGKLCVVGLPDDRILIKKLQRSRAPGFYHLLSQTEDPILDAEVMWAARVKNMVPR